MHVPIHAAEDAMVMIKHGVAGFITLLFSWQRLPYYQNVAGLDLLLHSPPVLPARPIPFLGGAGKRVFLDSMGDWFSPGVEKNWISAILDTVHRRPQHTFLVLTKRPDNIPEGLRWPENLWMGVSVTCQDDVWRIDELVHNSPLPGGSYLFVSFEPLHGPIEADLTGIGWVICGAESGNRKGKIIPELKWVKKIARDANHLGISVFIKNNLQELYRQQPGCLGGVQEFPEAMKR